MDIGEIAERLIQAAEIEEAALRGKYGPKPPRSLSLPVVHTYADKAGWGSERLAEDRKEFWENLARTPTARQVSDAEQALSWLAVVPDEGQRFALAAWARCMAVPRETFQKWCRRQGIHPETGRRRKDRALARISAHLVRSVVQNCNSDCSPLLHSGPKIGHVSDTVADDAPERDGLNSWAADDAFSPFLVGEHDFSWASKRNELRRQRLARQRRQQAA